MYAISDGARSNNTLVASKTRMVLPTTKQFFVTHVVSHKQHLTKTERFDFLKIKPKVLIYQYELYKKIQARYDKSTKNAIAFAKATKIYIYWIFCSR